MRVRVICAIVTVIAVASVFTFLNGCVVARAVAISNLNVMPAGQCGEVRCQPPPCPGPGPVPGQGMVCAHDFTPDEESEQGKQGEEEETP